jgi:glycosyltransferase involved in cell wall biosynthesis
MEKEQLRRMYNINDNENMLFFIGRLVTVKGIYNLVRAMPSILEDYPNSKLVILGIGDMESELKSLANELNIQDKLIFRTEFIDEKERIIHYAASDCVILPSSYEPFGIVCTEAMSMEKPTVVGANGTSGFREQIIPDGERRCGVHINPHDPNDIAWGVKEILKLEDKGRQIGKYARERVLETFSWDSVTKRTIDIYKELV